MQLEAPELGRLGSGPAGGLLEGNVTADWGLTCLCALSILPSLYGVLLVHPIGMGWISFFGLTTATVGGPLGGLNENLRCSAPASGHGHAGNDVAGARSRTDLGCRRGS